MASPSQDKEWATKYLLDPMNAPAPSDETGPGTHFNSTVDRAHSTAKKEPSVSVSSKSPSASAYPSPPVSASPTQSSFHPSNPFSPSHRQLAFGEYQETGPARKSFEDPVGKGKGHRRGSSLGEKFPGDMSHRPLDLLRKEAKAANRAPHLKKKHMPGADIIDSLDVSVLGGAYHHEGPYDATLIARNTNQKSSPLEAVRGTNAEAIRATPREYIKDSLTKHVPLQGTSVIPPGMSGMDGRTMRYEEGADLMREPDAAGGAYKRWPGVKYLPEDYKGKGEPSFSIERALKEQEQNSRRGLPSDGSNTYELQPRDRPVSSRQRSVSGSHANIPNYSTGETSGTAMNNSQYDGDMRRSNTTGNKISGGLKKRFGSLRKGKKSLEA